MISANIDRDTRKAVYQRDGWRCALCDSTRGLQIHHAIPRGKGGAQEHEHNLITLCYVCHAQAHGDMLVPGGLTQADINQSVVEYLADYYAIEGWWPWRPGYDPSIRRGR